MLITSRLKSRCLLDNVVYPCTILAISLCPVSAMSADGIPTESFNMVLKRANTLYSEKKFDAACREFERALKIDGGSLAAWRSLGWSYWARGQKKRAYQVWLDLLAAFPGDVKTLLALGKASEQDRQWNKALSYYDDALKLAPNNKDVNRGRARIFMAQRNFRSAEKSSRAAMNQDKSDNLSASLLAETLMAQGRYKESERLSRNLVKTHPDVNNIRRLATLLDRGGHAEEAIGYYTQLLRHNPDNRSIRQARNRLYQARERALNNERTYQHQYAEKKSKILEESRSMRYAALSERNAKIRIADRLMKKGHYHDVVHIMQDVTRNNPVPSHLRRLGNAYARLGQYEQAASVYKKSLAIQTDSATLSAWRGLGTGLRKLGENQRAYAMWHDVLQKFPNDSPTLMALGKASEQDQQWQQGLNYYDQILKNAPNDQKAHLGKARLFSAQQNYQLAHEEIKSALNYAPSNTVKEALAENLVAMNRHQEAEQLLQQLVHVEPTAKTFQLLGDVLAKSNKNDAAITYFSKSLQLKPNDAKAVLGLAHTYWHVHRYPDAIILLQHFLNQYPDNDVARAHLAEHESAAGYWVQAENELKLLVEKHPDNSLWKVKLARQLHTSGHYTESLQLAEAVIKNEPDQLNALNLLANDAIFSGDIENGIRWVKRIVTIKPTPEKVNQLGKLHIEFGRALEQKGRHDAAMREYVSAETEFQRATDLDPIKSRAPLGMVETLRLQKRYDEAQQLAETLYKMHPGSVDVLLHLSDIASEKGDYTTAHKWLKQAQPFMPNTTQFQQKQAKLTFYSGQHDKSLDMLNNILETPNNAPSIPVLLYHGITVSDRDDTVPLKKFRDQLYTLKKAGYHTISMAQLLDFLNGDIKLPSKPFLITFDDARMDSFEYADPVLEETGFRATMFVPVADVGTSGAYTAVFSDLRNAVKTGRWDLQCHGTEAQHYVQVNAQNHNGRFMANKKWSNDTHQIESSAEFSDRINRDLQTCQDTLRKEIPDANIFAFAYPYSDQGHKSLSNDADIFAKNQNIVKEHFQLAFHVNNDNLVTRNSSRFALPRFEVPRTYTGAELVRQLKATDPKTATSYQMAELAVKVERYSQAITLFDKLDREGAVAPMDKASFLTTTGKVLSRNGDRAGARARFEKSLSLRPNDVETHLQIAALDRQLRPTLQTNSQYFEDNQGRSYYSFSPSIQFPISDKLTLSAYYRYLDFNQMLHPKNIENVTEQYYQASINQFEGQLRYDLGAKTVLSLSAGAADYSSSATPASPTTSGSIFPLGTIKLTSGINDKVELSGTVDHTYVNTAGAIVNGIAFTRMQAGLKLKLFDTLQLSANQAYSYYSDNNRRNRTEIQLSNRVWNDPDITVGAQLIYDDTLHNNPLFWTPNNYIGFSLPMSLKKKWGQSLAAELVIAPGMGREADKNFQFQFNTMGSLNWNINKNLNLFMSLNRYQAATYANFNATAGISLKF